MSISLKQFISKLELKAPWLLRAVKPVVPRSVRRYFREHGTASAPKQRANDQGVQFFYPNVSEAVNDEWRCKLLDVLTRRPKVIGSTATGNHIVMLVVSNLSVDPRVQREAEELARAGWNVSVLCPDFTQGDTESIDISWHPAINIYICGWTAANFMSEEPGFLASELFKRALDLLDGEVPFAFHCHDLFTCAAGLALAHQTGAHLVADFHEWTSENIHWNIAIGNYEQYPPGWKKQLQDLEARVLEFASATITVCDSIADALIEELGGLQRPVVIRNIPALSASPTHEYPPLKVQLGLDKNQFVLLWQGGTGPTRLIEPIIEALEFAPGCVFVVRGPSLDLFGPQYRMIAEKIGVSDRLLLCDPVPSQDVVAAARGADAGIWTLPRLCRNFTYALPNKIFEYMASGVALIVADYPEARRMVETHDIGLVFDPYDPQSIASAINRLIEEPSLRARLAANAMDALTTIDAKREWCKLVDIYNGLQHQANGLEPHKIR